MLQGFVPLPHFITDFVNVKEPQTNWDATPSIHTDISLFAPTLNNIIDGSQGNAKIHADVFGIELLNHIINERIGGNSVRLALDNVLNAGLASGYYEGNHSVPFSIQDARANDTVLRDRISTISRDNGARAENEGLDVIVNNLVHNTGLHSGGGTANAMANARVRYSYRTFNEIFGSKFLEFAIATPQTTFSNAIVNGENELDSQFRQAFRGLKIDRMSSESLFFAILPGFSSRPTGIRRPNALASNGMALFYQSQLARVGGAMAILSGNKLLLLGKVRNGGQRVPWRWENKMLTLRQNISGTVVGSNFRYDRLKLHSTTMNISFVCAQQFWDQENVVGLLRSPAFLTNDRDTLESLYVRYLNCESRFLHNLEHFNAEIVDRFSQERGFDREQYLFVRARLLNAGPANIPLDDNMKSLPKTKSR